MLPKSGAAAALVLLALGLLGAPASAATPEYFKLPTGTTFGVGLTTMPGGIVWFAGNQMATTQPVLGRFTVASGAPGTTAGMDTFPTPKLNTSCCANQMRGVAADPVRSRVWFTQSDGIYGFANALGVTQGSTNGITAFQQPDLRDMWDVAVNPADGMAWITERSAYNVAHPGTSYFPGNRIAQTTGGSLIEHANIATQAGRTTLDPLRYDAKPTEIALDASGQPWFTESDPGNPGYRIGTTNGLSDYSEYLLPCHPVPPATAPCSGSYTGDGGPWGIAVAQDGSIWFTNLMRNEVARFDVATKTITEYALPASDSTLTGGVPRSIVAASDGTLWVAENGSYAKPNASALLRIVPDPKGPTITVHKTPGGHQPIAVAPDEAGNIWFSDVEKNALGRLSGVLGPPAGAPTGPAIGGGGETPTFTPPASPAPGATKLVATGVGRAKLTDPRVSGDTVSIDQICLGPPEEPCAVVYILSAGEYVTGFPGTKPRASIAAKKKKAKGVVLGRTAVTLHGGQKRTVKVKLNAKGRALLKKRKKLALYLNVQQKGANGKPITVKRTKVTLRAKKK
ncbi:MAG: hypothetical protein JHC95_11430 [Solirubrobacteraceae bacterium]|nr:hypothetical protein [Solirubrobacteraceae bacterium]